MRRTLPALLVPIALAGLATATVAGCSSSDTEAGADSGASDVPAGVATMYETVEAEIAERGGEQSSGEWRVGYIVEAAEPWFEGHGEHSGYREPSQGETHHIEIIPFERSTGRIVPDVPVHLEVLDEQGDVVDEQDLHHYYSTFFHYADNFSVPDDGTYTLRATLGAPTFLRHGDESDGPALAHGATVEFDGVELSAE